MRIETITAINTQKQHDPHSTQNITAATHKSTSGSIFAEYLKANLQQVSAPVIPHHTENQIAGLLRGYFTPLKINQKLEPKQENDAS